MRSKSLTSNRLESFLIHKQVMKFCTTRSHIFQQTLKNWISNYIEQKKKQRRNAFLKQVSRASQVSKTTREKRKKKFITHV
jgi:hypothetical protein